MTAPLRPQSAKLSQEIRGEVGYIAEKFALSVDATEAIYSMFCGQAQRWEAKVHAGEDRITNQRDEIKRLAEAYARAAAPRQCFHGCTACEGSGVEYDSPGKTRPCSECGGKRSIYAQLEKLRASNERLIQMYADLSNSIRPNDKLPRVGESPTAAPAAPLPPESK